MEKIIINEYQKDGFVHISLENDEIRAVILPEIGGKMIELLNKKSGRQFLLEPQNREQTYKRAFYGANYEDYDTSGFDECFPTIEESEYPLLKNTTNKPGIIFPDHGEIWSLPWEYWLSDSGLVLTINGKRFPYRFEKRIKINKNNIILNYKLENFSKESFAYIWSAHPLLKVNPGEELLLSKQIDHIFLNWASDSGIGEFGDILPWPHLSSNNKNINYSKVQDKNLGMAVKCFTGRLKEGFAGVYYRDDDESILFQFDIKENPYLGLWLCYGGWPVNGGNKHLTVGLEPCSGRPDSLKEAINRNEFSEVGAEGVKEWFLKIGVCKGLPEAFKANKLNS